MSNGWDEKHVGRLFLLNELNEAKFVEYVAQKHACGRRLTESAMRHEAADPSRSQLLPSMQRGATPDKSWIGTSFFEAKTKYFVSQIGTAVQYSTCNVQHAVYI